MLKLAADFATDFRITLFITGYLAFDQATGIYMQRSYGRRRNGRPGRYYLGALDRARDLPREEQKSAWPEPTIDWSTLFPPDFRWPRITAYSDAEAVEKANKWLAQELEARGQSSSAPV
jgi:hypothetical protein